MPRTADTRLGLGIPSLDQTETPQVTPEAVKARIGEFFNGANLLRNGVFSLDTLRQVNVRRTMVRGNDFDPESLWPFMGGFGSKYRLDTDAYYSGKRVSVKEARVTINGFCTARRIIPSHPITPFSIESTRKGLVVVPMDEKIESIEQLYGEFMGGQVVISVLNSVDGSSTVLFPERVIADKGDPLVYGQWPILCPDGHNYIDVNDKVKVGVAETLGVKV